MTSIHESGPVAWWTVRRAPRRRPVRRNLSTDRSEWPPVSVLFPDEPGWATVTGPLAHIFSIYPFLDLRRQLKRIGMGSDAARAMEAALARGRTIVIARYGRLDSEPAAVER